MNRHLKIATQIAAAMVSSIRDVETYERMKKLAQDADLQTVSDWVAAEAFKQADALIRENQRRERLGYQ